MEIRVFNIYDFSSCVAKPPIKLSITTKSICLISWPCFLGLFNPQNRINWLGGVQLLSLYLTWWGARYHKSSCTLSINKLKLSRFIQRTPGIIHLNNVNRRSVKIIFPLTRATKLVLRQFNCRGDVNFFIVALNKLSKHQLFQKFEVAEKIFQVFEDPSNFLEVKFLYFHTGLIRKTEVIMT